MILQTVWRETKGRIFRLLFLNLAVGMLVYRHLIVLYQWETEEGDIRKKNKNLVGSETCKTTPDSVDHEKAKIVYRRLIYSFISHFYQGVHNTEERQEAIFGKLLHSKSDEHCTRYLPF